MEIFSDSLEKNKLTGKLRSFPEIKEIKFANPELCKFNGQNIFTHSKKISEKFNNGDDRKIVIQSIALYVVSPAVIDIFSDDSIREDWSETLKQYEGLYEFYNLNRIRKNIISHVLSPLDICDLLFGIKNPSWKRDVKENFKIIKSKNDYNNFTIDQKMEIVNQVTILARKSYQDIVDSFQ